MPTTAHKSMLLQDMNQSRVHAEESLPVLAGEGAAAAARDDSDSRPFVDLQPVPANSKRPRDGGDAAPCARTTSSSFEGAPRLGPVQLAAYTSFAWAKKPRSNDAAAAPYEVEKQEMIKLWAQVADALSASDHPLITDWCPQPVRRLVLASTHETGMLPQAPAAPIAEDEVTSSMPVRCATQCSGLEVAPALRPAAIPLNISKSCSIAFQQSRYTSSCCSSHSIGVILFEHDNLEAHKVLKLCLSLCLMFNCNWDSVLQPWPPPNPQQNPRIIIGDHTVFDRGKCIQFLSWPLQQTNFVKDAVLLSQNTMAWVHCCSALARDIPKPGYLHFGNGDEFIWTPSQLSVSCDNLLALLEACYIGPFYCRTLVRIFQFLAIFIDSKRVSVQRAISERTRLLWMRGENVATLTEMRKLSRHQAPKFSDIQMLILLEGSGGISCLLIFLGNKTKWLPVQELKQTRGQLGSQRVSPYDLLKFSHTQGADKVSFSYSNMPKLIIQFHGTMKNWLKNCDGICELLKLSLEMWTTATALSMSDYEFLLLQCKGILYDRLAILSSCNMFHIMTNKSCNLIFFQLGVSVTREAKQWVEHSKCGNRSSSFTFGCTSSVIIFSWRTHNCNPWPLSILSCKMVLLPLITWLNHMLLPVSVMTEQLASGTINEVIMQMLTRHMVALQFASQACFSLLTRLPGLTACQVIVIIHLLLNLWIWITSTSVLQMLLLALKLGPPSYTSRCSAMSFVVNKVETQDKGSQFLVTSSNANDSTLLPIEGMQQSWDLGGSISCGLGASRVSSGGECHGLGHQMRLVGRETIGWASKGQEASGKRHRTT